MTASRTVARIGATGLLLMAACQRTPSPSPIQLTLELHGDGSGRVEGPAGFRCNSGRCEGTLAASNAMLYAVADPSSVFVGWSGDCSGSVTWCEVASGIAVVTAEFARTPATTCSSDARPPDPIRKFTVNVGIERIDWAWAPPKSDCPVTDYALTSNALENDASEIITPETHYLMTSAGVGLYWCIFVRARSRAGASSPVSMCGLLPDTPPAPVNVIAFPSNGGADVYWRNPETTPLPPPEAVTGYNVLAFPSGANQFASTTPLMVRVPQGSDHTLRAHVSGLTNGVTYRFAVDALDDVGPSTRFEGGAQPSNPVTPPASSWHAGPMLPEPRGDHFSFVFGSYLYLVGGSNGPWTLPPPDVRAHVEQDGSLAAWEPIPATVPRRHYSSGALYVPGPSSAFVYVTGGFDLANGRGQSSDVLMAPIGSDGIVGNWSVGGAMPANRTVHATVVYKEFLYIIGGITTTEAFTTAGQAWMRDIQYSRLQQDGTISDWMTTTPLPFGRAFLAAAVHKNHLYVFGGQTEGVMPRHDVLQFASLGEDGSITGAWSATTAQPIGNSFTSMIIDGDRIYVLGSDDWQKGGGGGARTGSLQVGMMDPATGDVTSWTNLESDGYFGLHSSTAATIWNSTIYVPGGLGVSGTGLATVQYARLGPDGHVAPF